MKPTASDRSRFNDQWLSLTRFCVAWRPSYYKELNTEHCLRDSLSCKDCYATTCVLMCKIQYTQHYGFMVKTTAHNSNTTNKTLSGNCMTLHRVLLLHTTCDTSWTNSWNITQQTTGFNNTTVFVIKKLEWYKDMHCISFTINQRRLFTYLPHSVAYCNICL